MGWLRLVGSLKLQVSFAKESHKRDDILQKRPTILRSLLIEATPYVLIISLHICGHTNTHLHPGIFDGRQGEEEEKEETGRR